MFRTRIRSTVLFLFIVTGSLWAAPGNLRLLPSFTISNSVSVDSEESSQRFKLSIPDDVWEVRISLSDAQADLDLYLYDSYGDVVTYAEESYYNEELILNRLGRPALEPGEYELEVLYQLGRPPVMDGRIMGSISFKLRMEFIRIPRPVEIDLDKTYSEILPVVDGGIQFFHFNLPRDSSKVRVDLFNTDADLDFALNPGESFVDPYYALFAGDSYMSNEHGVFDVSGISDRSYYLMVLPGVYEERDVNFSLRVSADVDPPGFLLGFPEIPSNPRDMERNILATVELSTLSSGGSGCIISPEGYILTNYHVIEDDNGDISDPIAVGITLDPRRPSVESFLAEPVFYDRDRDLAILKIGSGLYGQPLPPDLSFPYFEFADMNSLKLGDDLLFLGYPGVGGLGSKVTITLTRGTLSGFEDLGLGMTLKTDGEINYGNSGGAALTSDYKLAGIPTEINPDSGGKLAYIHSIDMLPPEWLNTIGLR